MLAVPANTKMICHENFEKLGKKVRQKKMPRIRENYFVSEKLDIHCYLSGNIYNCKRENQQSGQRA